MLYRLVAEKITVFVTTHYMDEAEHCQRLAFIQRGKLIAYGAPRRIKEEMMHGQVLEIAPSNAAKAISLLRESKLGLEEIALYGALVHVISPDIVNKMDVISDLLNSKGVDPGSMAIIEPSLEDVFIACMRD